MGVVGVVTRLLTGIGWTDGLILGAVLTIIIFMLRIPIVWASLPRSTLKPDVSLAAVLVPKGLAAAVLASMPLQQGMASGQLIESATYSVVLFSMVLCSILVLLLEKTSLLGFYCLMFPPNAEGTTVESAATPPAPQVE